MISNSGHDENGKLSGGKAGDQGGEWVVQSWYNRPWTVVLRHTKPEVGRLISELAKEAADNDLIGYDQGDRYTFWQQMKESGYHPKNISTPCEADCSAGVAAIVKASGFLTGDKKLQGVSIYAYTGDLKKILTAAGFTAITDKSYLTSDSWLKAGDVLLYEGHHTAINLTDGEKVTEDTWYPSVLRSADLKVTADVNVRKGPGTRYAVLDVLKKGTQITAKAKAFASKSPWIQLENGGWISARYVEGWLLEPNSRWWYVQPGYEYPAYCLKNINGEDYAFDREGWNISSDRIASDNSIVD